MLLKHRRRVGAKPLSHIAKSGSVWTIRICKPTCDNKIIITTHSPYLINYLSLAIKAHEVWGVGTKSNGCRKTSEFDWVCRSHRLLHWSQGCRNLRMLARGYNHPIAWLPWNSFRWQFTQSYFGWVKWSIWQIDRRAAIAMKVNFLNMVARNFASPKILELKTTVLESQLM